MYKNFLVVIFVLLLMIMTSVSALASTYNYEFVFENPIPQETPAFVVPVNCQRLYVRIYLNQYSPYTVLVNVKKECGMSVATKWIVPGQNTPIPSPALQSGGTFCLSIRPNSNYFTDSGSIPLYLQVRISTE